MHIKKEERERDFGLLESMGVKGKSHPRLRNGREKLHLEAQRLWWSVGEDGVEEAFSSFP